VKQKFKFFSKPLFFFLGVANIAWAIGFFRYLGYWVYFPVIPNIVDVIGLSLVGLYLILYSLDRKEKLDTRSPTGSLEEIGLYEIEEGEV
jgi:hypothetical protein